MHFATGTVLLGLQLLWLAALVACDGRLRLHIDDRTLFSRAGYFSGRYLYRGGVPSVKQQTEQYNCLQFCRPASPCQLRASVNVTTPMCVLWSVTENGGDETSYGKCKCTQRTARYCTAYTCDQSVTQYSQTCNDECFVSSSTFGKVKSCTCDDIPDSGRGYCSSWTCYGYGDGPIKTAHWSCFTPLSAMDGSAGTYTNDFCWTFGSDQTSTKVAEVKDCQCTAMDASGSYCDQWLCIGRLANRWIWWSSVLASPLAALLNLWVPFVVRATDEGGVAAASIVWALLTYLLIVLLGGIPSLIANTVALGLVSMFVFRKELPSFRRARDYNKPVTIDGKVLCPTCKSLWSEPAVGSVASNETDA